jgi:tRNA A-37 threonylcarbamoyl transferase component Bud32
VTEGEGKGHRVIGFLLQKIPGRHAGPTDIQVCRDVIARLHALGIHHGDLNRHNFLVQDSRAYLLYFESVRKTEEKQELDKEMDGLEGMLCSDSRRGGRYTDSA